MKAPGWLEIRTKLTAEEIADFRREWEALSIGPSMQVVIRVRKWHPGYWLVLWRAPQDVPFWFRAWFLYQALTYRAMTEQN